MDTFKHIMLVLIALLLVVLIVDRVREPQQMGEVHEELQDASRNLERLEQQQRSLERQQQSLEKELALTRGVLEGFREGLRHARLAPVPDGADAGTPTTEQADDQQQDSETRGTGVGTVQNGQIKLGVNFLLPPDVDHYHPEWVGGTYRTFRSTPNKINPVTASSAVASDIDGLVNDSLCIRHPATKTRWSEALATSCVISDSYTTYTFTIRDGVYWQRPQIADRDGFEWLDQEVPLTAHDFVFMLAMIKNPDVIAPHLKAYYEDCTGFRAIDDHTLEITWAKKDYSSISACLGLTPLPRHIYGVDEDGDDLSEAEVGVTFNQHWFDEQRQMIGVGPYRLTEYAPDKHVVFERNPAYWGGGYHFERIEWDAQVKEDDAQLIAFKNNQVPFHSLTSTQYKRDILDSNDPRFNQPDADDPTLTRAGRFGWETTKYRAYYFIGWNMRRPLFSDKRVRQALSHAFPKERIINEVHFGLGRPQAGPVHRDNPNFNEYLLEHDFNFDLDRARALLAEAGWSDTDNDGWLDKEIGGERRPLKFLIRYYANSPEWDSTLLIYKDVLKTIGVDMQATPYEWKVLLGYYENFDFDATVGGWRVNGLDSDFVQVWHSKFADQAGSSNHVGYRNERVDELAEQLRETFDPAERQDIVHEIQLLIHEDQPYTFFYTPEPVRIWHNAGPMEIDGVEYGFQHFHPLYSTSQLWWHLPNAE